MSEEQRASGKVDWMVEVRELTARYGRTVAVDRVSLRVAPGEVYVLLGRNGAGKSSLVRCLLGLQRPAEGRALLCGQDAWRARHHALRQVGVVPEESDLPPALCARALAEFAARLYRTWDAAFVRERLERQGVPHDVPVAQLSRGQRAQLLLTLALGHRPAVLVLDDPTLGLDAVARREVWDSLIVELADRGTTVFLTTHDVAGVEGVANRVGILAGGRLLLDEPLEALRERFRRVLLPPGAAPDGLFAGQQVVSRRESALGWEVIVKRWDLEVAAAVAGHQEASALGMSLEDIFVAVTTAANGVGAR